MPVHICCIEIFVVYLTVCLLYYCCSPGSLVGYVFPCCFAWILFNQGFVSLLLLTWQIEQDAYQEDLGFSSGQLGKGGVAGPIRGPTVDKKTQVSISKRLQVCAVWGGCVWHQLMWIEVHTLAQHHTWLRWIDTSHVGTGLCGALHKPRQIGGAFFFSFFSLFFFNISELHTEIFL